MAWGITVLIIMYREEGSARVDHRQEELSRYQIQEAKNKLESGEALFKRRSI